MTESDPTATRPERVLDAGALKALAHPLRVQMYDILSQYGAQTASSLAALTGESTGSTSYHLRALAKHDLIREVEGRGSARERWWEREKGSVSFTNPEAMKTPSGRAATQVVMTEFLNRRHQQLLRFVGDSIRTPAEIDDMTALISTANLRLTPDQAKELNERFSALIDEASDRYRGQDEAGTQPYTVRVDVFALPEGGN
ncbi:DNA-binding transcriptional ArsR family regulator [Microbacterium marinum]|uniref:DNA-binding transcriptional ArsR family regulator n=1 Tax=Microbacterium marinum TaxID=421115 RepID=A0A7W7BRG6_9MICO|nr:helix-turn-helix domain-containing protein [Microbacterium marinum]MBB4667497.1 DNA-binding transcriptional ArsR family regulator [Microbacterium marinum]